MFTKNAKTWLDMQMGGWNSIITHAPKNAFNGDAVTAVYNYTFQNLYTAMGTFATENIKTYASTSSAYRYGVAFGTGSGIVTEEDYTFFGDHILGLSSTNVTVVRDKSVNEDKGKTTFSTTYTINNTLNNDITIGEIGLFYQICTANSSGGRDKNGAYLFEHSVLETPITIPAGGVGRVTYNIIMEYPSST